MKGICVGGVFQPRRITHAATAGILLGTSMSCDRGTEVIGILLSVVSAIAAASAEAAVSAGISGHSMQEPRSSPGATVDAAVALVAVIVAAVPAVAVPVSRLPRRRSSSAVTVPSIELTHRRRHAGIATASQPSRRRVRTHHRVSAVRARPRIAVYHGWRPRGTGVHDSGVSAPARRASMVVVVLPRQAVHREVLGVAAVWLGVAVPGEGSGVSVREVVRAPAAAVRGRVQRVAVAVPRVGLAVPAVVGMVEVIVGDVVTLEDDNGRGRHHSGAVLFVV